MAYCTQSDLRSALSDPVKLDDWAGGDAGRIDQAIETAQGEIDGYLASADYLVPLSSVPLNVKNYCIDIALYNMAVVGGFQTESDMMELKSKYEMAVKFMQGVATGKFKIPLAATGTEPEAAGSVEQKYYVKPGGGRLNLEAF